MQISSPLSLRDALQSQTGLELADFSDRVPSTHGWCSLGVIKGCLLLVATRLRPAVSDRGVLDYFGVHSLLTIFDCIHLHDIEDIYLSL